MAKALEKLNDTQIKDLNEKVSALRDKQAKGPREKIVDPKANKAQVSGQSPS